MLMGRLQQFIRDLDLALQKDRGFETDPDFLAEFKPNFAESDPALSINPTQEAYWFEHYTLRWQQLRQAVRGEGGSFSATINQIWVSFAEALAEESAQYYLSDNCQSVYTVNDVLVQFSPQALSSQSLPVSDLLKCKNNQVISIKQLFQLRNKTQAIAVGELHYPSVWEFLSQQMVSIDLACDANCYLFFPQLVELINLYQPDGDNSQFITTLKEFNAFLTNSPAAEVRKLYSQPIDCKGRTIYLFQILVDCWAGMEVSEQLGALAEWFYHQNHSIICTSSFVQPIYARLAAGAFFSIARLRELVARLPVASLLPLQDAVAQVKTTLETLTQITPDVIEQLGGAYALRWPFIMDKADYLLEKGGANRAWTELAEDLAGAGLIDSHYYQFLIPPLVNKVIPSLANEPLTTFPLHFYTLSERGDELISLLESERHYLAKGTFYNCNNLAKPVPFTSREKLRLLKAHPDFQEFFMEAYGRQSPRSALTKKTIDAITDLVKGSLFVEGLIYKKSYSPPQLQAAENAYVEFTGFLDMLASEDPLEYDNVYAHSVVLNGSCKTVAEVMSNIQNPSQDPALEDEKCVAVGSEYFMKLVIDYNPTASFSRTMKHLGLLFTDNSLNDYVEQHGIREQSFKKSYRDAMGHEEAVRRLSTILVSLMTHPFTVFYRTGSCVEALGFRNVTTDTGKKIFDSLKPLLDNGTIDTPFSVYDAILNKIILPAMSPSYKSALTRYPDTTQWLVSIQNEGLFAPEQAIYFALESIFNALVAWRKQQTVSHKRNEISAIIDELLRHFFHGYSPYQIGLAVNINLIQLLQQKQYLCIQSAFLSTLRSGSACPDFDMKTILCNYFLDRLSAPEQAPKTSGFFTERLQPSAPADDLAVKAILQTAFSGIKKEDWLGGVVEQISQLISEEQTLSPEKKLAVRAYLMSINPALSFYKVEEADNEFLYVVAI